MKNNTTLLAFGTFGSPNGFTQTAFLGNTDIRLKEFDLNTNAIKLFPNTNLTAVRKEMHGLSYAFYSFAREKGSTRGGTFIGSALYYEGLKAKEDISMEVLKNFHQYLIQNNVANEEIKVLHSNELSIAKPQDFDKLEMNTEEKIPSTSFTKNHLVIYDKNGSSILNGYLKKAPLLFPKYDVIYFTADEQVAKYVQERGLFTLTDKNGFFQEIEKIEQEKERKIQKIFSDLEAEIQTLENDKNNIVQNILTEIDKQQKKHNENANKIGEYHNNVSKIKSLYYEYKTELQKLLQEFRSNGAIEIVLQKKKTLKDNLDRNILPLKKVSSISTIVENRVHQVYTPPITNNIDEEKINELKKDENRWFKIAFFTGIFALVLLLTSLGIGWWGYSKYSELEKKMDSYKTDSYKNELLNENSYPNEEIPTDTSSEEKEEYDFLNQNDVDYVNKTLGLHKAEIDDVVEEIFKKNPKDIGKPFENKKEKYSITLYEMNKECFEIKDRDTIITKPLIKIPKERK